MKFFKKGPMPVQKRTAPPAKVGGWLAADVKVEERKAKAAHPAHSTLLNSSVNSIYGHGSLETNAPNRTLTTEQLWQCYYRVPEVRACIDSIGRRVSTWDWSVQASELVDVSDTAHYEKMTEVAQKVTRFLKNPDKDGRTFQQMMFMLIIDLLVFDAAAIEPVKDRKKRIQELRARRGDDFRVVTDRYGQVDHYVQHAGNSSAIKFKKDELVYLNLFPNTTYPEGMPIIETILNEIVAVLRYGERAMKSADANEIPPGLLVLSGVSGRAAADAMQDFRSEAGQDQKLRMLHFPSPQAGSADWINMQSSSKDLELNEVIERITRTIWRAFGVMPVEMGAVSDVNRSTAQAQMDVASSHLITPILELIEGMLNTRIIPALVKEHMGDDEHYDHIEFKFDREAKLTQKDQEARIDMLGRAIGAGMMSRNEARNLLGMLPVENGDTLTVGEGNMILRLEDVTAGVTPIDAYADSYEPEDEDPDDTPDGDGKKPEPQQDESRAVGDEDPTNFPAKGDDKKVSLRNSEHGIFDPAYAADLKENWPKIWKKGGNIKGNSQYAALKPVVANNGSVNTTGEERAVRLREAWAARHTGDHRIAGVIAQVKWFVVGSRGESYMKKVISEAKKKSKK